MEDIYDIPMSSFILSSLKIHYIPKRFTTYPYINAKEEIPYRYVPWIAERIISIRYLLNTCSNEDSICIKAYICNRCSFHENPHMSYTDLIQFTLNEYIKFINSHINICDGESKFDSELREWYHKNKAQLHEDLKKEIVNGESKTFNNEFNCKTSKKENLTINICFRNMLSQIPGVSTSMANVYVEKYKNMENFILNIKEQTNNDKNKIIKLLSDEKYGTNNRRIGDKVGEKIYNFLFNIDINLKSEVENNKISEKVKKTKILQQKSMFQE
jgi:hypothetical protein